jgi:hypothetical protein
MLQPLSSFAASFYGAEEFAQDADTGIVLAAVVPADRIFAMPSSGAGCLFETEMIVLGGEMDCTIRRNWAVGDEKSFWQPLKDRRNAFRRLGF